MVPLLAHFTYPPFSVFKTETYDKRDDFEFDIVNFLFLNGDVPLSNILWCLYFSTYSHIYIIYFSTSSHITSYKTGL